LVAQLAREIAEGVRVQGEPDAQEIDIDDETEMAEGGSSVSGIFNSSGQLAGQLFGRCSSDGTNPEDMDCGNIDSFWAMYGEFEETHPLISWWLNVGGTLHVDHSSSPPGIGTQGWPFTWIYLALDRAWPGVRIKIAAGSYNETFTINQDVTLVAQRGMVTIGE